MVDAPCRVFISYALDSPDHMAAELALHDVPRAQIIDATMDRFYNGQKWLQWMARPGARSRLCAGHRVATVPSTRPQRRRRAAARRPRMAPRRPTTPPKWQTLHYG
jgi:hypothetical protein